MQQFINSLLANQVFIFTGFTAVTMRLKELFKKKTTTGTYKG